MTKTLLLSEWMLPISKPPVKKAAVLVENGKILYAGPTSKLPKITKAEVRDLGNAVLLPGLVNAHTHLEYSCLKNKIHSKEKFTDWVKDIIRIKKKMKTSDILRGIKKGVEELIQSGTSLIGEVTNTGISAKVLGNSPLEGAIFYEMLGGTPFETFKEKEKILNKEAPHFQISPACHAPHTVSLELTKSIRDYVQRKRKITSIHTAESEQEMEWMRSKTGVFAEIFQQTQTVHNSLIGTQLSSVEYLNKIKFLTSQVLCVHCTFAENKDISVLKRKIAPIVLCPRSNLYTGRHIAPVEQFIRAGIPLALGTDSLASNEDLNLWNEMSALKKIFPFLPLTLILRMATLNGAKALGYGRSHGSIERGKKADFIYVMAGLRKISNPYSFLMEEKHEKIHRYPN